ncbi:MAG: D-alanyl-D-alanine carboxypeptidase/D-alanyl-D-alanine-endopeptidase [Chitinophagaceae bacterium]
MLRLTFLLVWLLTFFYSTAQGLTVRLQEAVRKMEADPQFKHALLGFCMLDSKTGKVLFERNSQIGLAPASCQKVITSVAAFELLGKDYRYKTVLGYSGQIVNGTLEGNLLVKGTGDPTLGSWRWPSTRENVLLQKWTSELKQAGIKNMKGVVSADIAHWSSATIPNGWIWQDIGNYYGAGASVLNWRENQFDVVLRSGNTPGDQCSIVSISPKLSQPSFTCEVKAGAKGSGDNAYIYLPADSPAFIRGTIPPGETAFTISGSFTNSARQLTATLTSTMQAAGIQSAQRAYSQQDGVNKTFVPVFTHLSPTLDSINHWFLKKSINLYGEALIKTIAFEKDGFGDMDKGLEMVKLFWSQRGIEKSAINIYDGSGLSPQNRVTTDALAKVMLYARSKPWFQVFSNSLPVINGVAMKSGSIGGARSYTGYLNNKDGNGYTFAIIVNNYDGNSNEVVRKIWALLDILK